MIKAAIHHLARSTRGSVYIETAMSVFVLFVFVIGLTRVVLYTNELGVQERLLRAATDITWQLEEEQGASLTQGDLDDVVASLVGISGESDDAKLQLRLRMFDADASGIVTQSFTGTSGGLSEPSRVSFTAAGVSLPENTYGVANDERLVVVEFFIRRRGSDSGGIKYLPMVILKPGFVE